MAIKRLVAVLGGLLMMPAFAEIAPLGYDEVFEISDAEIVEENFDNEFSDDELANIYGGDTADSQRQIAEEMSEMLAERTDSKTENTLAQDLATFIYDYDYFEFLDNLEIDSETFTIADGVGNNGKHICSNGS